MSKSPKSAKAYRTFARFFFIAGLIVIIGSVLGDRPSTVTIGIALVVLGMASWRKSLELKDQEHKNPSE